MEPQDQSDIIIPVTALLTILVLSVMFAVAVLVKAHHC